jgi:hypothetical protein
MPQALRNLRGRSLTFPSRPPSFYRLTEPAAGPAPTAPPSNADFTSGPSYYENKNAPSSSGSGVSQEGGRYKPLAKGLFTFFNLGICVFMAATGALGVKFSAGVTDTGNAFVGVYMCLFAAILFSFEIIQLYPCDAIDGFYKRNFGFLYGVMGKSAYTCFMAILCFGLRKPWDLAMPCGIVVFAFGLFQVAYHWRFPDHFDKKEKYVP